jgi:hypothetical protein
VALGTWDYVLKCLEYPEILIRLEEIKTNFLKTILFKTEDAESLAQQA